MHGQRVEYIWLTECGYSELSMVLWLFLLLIVYIHVYLWAQGEKQSLRYVLSVAVDKDFTQGHWPVEYIFSVLRLCISKELL